MISDMNETKQPEIPRSYFRFIGRRGGAVTSEAKRKASRRSIAKARRARLAKLKEAKQNANPTAP